MLLIQQLARLLNNVLCQAQSATDIEGITAAGHAHEQTIGGSQRYRVKLHAGILHPLVTISEGLELAIVRGHHGQHLFLMQMLQHAHGQRRTLVRVSAGADFVDEHQIASLHFIQNAD